MAILSFSMPGPLEFATLGIILLLVFGRRLPEVARNMGRSLTEFKKGMREVQDVKTMIETEAKDALHVDGPQ